MEYNIVYIQIRVYRTIKSHHLLDMTIASLNSLRQFWRRAVRPPLVMTALVP